MKHEDESKKGDVDDSDAEDGRVARLIEFAGPRPGASELDLADVKEVVRARWEDLLDRRHRHRRSRYLQIAAAVVAAAGLAIWGLGLLSAPGEPVGTVRMAASALRVAGGEVDTSLVPGDLIRLRDELSAGMDGGAAVEMHSGVELRLDRRSSVRIRSHELIELRQGRIYVDTSRADDGATMAVDTRYGIVRDVGTRFEVSDGGGLVSVRVRDGAVEVERGGERHLAEGGTELTLTGDGGAVASQIDVWGDEWQWMIETTSGFTLEDASLGDFLDWVEGETGWTVEIDAETAEELRASRLHGSVEGLTVHDALDLVLTSTGLESERRDGHLLLRPMTALP
jgi:ferric-dicitrate binding protein FerR (iron transport regulator)